MKIGTETLSSILHAIEGHLSDHHLEIDRAYDTQGNELSISLTVKLAPGKKGGTDYEVAMSFVKDRVKVRSVGNTEDCEYRVTNAFCENAMFSGDRYEQNSQH